MEVKFYDTVDDKLLKYAVIISKSKGKWVLCKHKERNTYEIPGGHREEGENIFDTAVRELKEETGAIDFDIKPLCVYSVTDYGMLFYADIYSFESELHNEIESVLLFDTFPDNEMLTYPQIQPELIKYIAEKYGIM